MQYLFALSVYEVEPKSILFETNSNTTITHYCPIELNLNQIDVFVVGSPVYITGKVYKFSKDLLLQLNLMQLIALLLSKLMVLGTNSLAYVLRLMFSIIVSNLLQQAIMLY